MNYFAPLGKQDITAFHNNWGWFFTWGLALIVLGLVAIYYSAFTTVVSVVFLGVILAIVNGIVTLLLGMLILSQWPASGLFIIGLFIGIDLLFVGWIYTAAALSARALLNNPN